MLIKGGAVIETLAGAKRVVFDKTGTLTRGKPAVTDVISLASDSASMLGFAAAIERESSHPLATAIVSHAKEVGDPGLSASDVRIVPGKGMEGVVAGRKIFIGAPRHAETIARLGEVARAQITNLEEQGKTIAVVVGEGTALGLIAMRDDPRPEAHTALDKLKLQSVVPVMMTGDNSRTGAAIGRLLGITSLADMLPEDKSRAVAEMAAKETTIMVGDGVNDAPALAAAHVGVAIGSGTDVAMEAADAALMRDRVDDVPRMIDLARATMDNIRQNVAISLGLKLIFLVTTLMGYTGLWLAVFADTGATVLVTINAMRLLGFFRGRDKGEIAHQIGKYREAAG
ncbi:Zinc/cadmium/lead-transporting P-type ATPase [subsurface metagenome]